MEQSSSHLSLSPTEPTQDKERERERDISLYSSLYSLCFDESGKQANEEKISRALSSGDFGKWLLKVSGYYEQKQKREQQKPSISLSLSSAAGKERERETGGKERGKERKMRQMPELVPATVDDLIIIEQRANYHSSKRTGSGLSLSLSLSIS
jgi:hypothetical protein